MTLSDSDTLLVKRLPVSLSKTEIEDVLKHIGAVNVKVFDSKVKKQTAFAKFRSEEAAKEALFRLHQQNLFGSRLVVEFAHNSDWKCDENEVETKKQAEQQRAELQQEFIERLNSWAVGLNFTVPPPCHLNYRYPSPTAEPLLNIVNVLTYNTKFYTQVLHLMNKMNIPCPFDDSFPLQQNKIFNAFVLYILQNSVYEDELVGKEEQSSEEGSELESESEDSQIVSSSKTPRKRTAPSTTRASKRRKVFKAIQVSTKFETKSVPKTSVDEIFEKVDFKPAKKIEVKIPSEIPVTESASEVEEPGGFGVIEPVEKADVSRPCEKEDSKNIKKCITADELERNRLKERDLKTLPAFKNYNPGVPSCRLYVKNLPKHVTEADLQYIYCRYFIEGIDEQGSMFDIRLMQAGRMKGQAFITLQNVEQAELALKETNGFIIGNNVEKKPMCVQFARSAAATI